MITPHDILALAQKIDQAAKTEVEFRNCIGRAYYAAFLKAQDYRDTHGNSYATQKNGRRLGSHEQVIDSVKNFDHARASFFMGQLDTLKRLRRRADYKLEHTINAQKARDAVLDATTFIEWIDTLP